VLIPLAIKMYIIFQIMGIQGLYYSARVAQWYDTHLIIPGSRIRVPLLPAPGDKIAKRLTTKGKLKLIRGSPLFLLLKIILVSTI
jgi:hypothetical protein